MISYSRIRDRWLHRVRDQLRDQSIRGESARGLRAVYYRRGGKYCRWSRLPDRQATTFIIMTGHRSHHVIHIRSAS